MGGSIAVDEVVGIIFLPGDDVLHRNFDIAHETGLILIYDQCCSGVRRIDDHDTICDFAFREAIEKFTGYVDEIYFRTAFKGQIGCMYFHLKLIRVGRHPRILRGYQGSKP